MPGLESCEPLFDDLGFPFHEFWTYALTAQPLQPISRPCSIEKYPTFVTSEAVVPLFYHHIGGSNFHDFYSFLDDFGAAVIQSAASAASPEGILQP